MPKAKAKPKQAEVKAPIIKSIDQLSVQKEVSNKLGISLSLASEVIELEQKITMEYVRQGYKVIKKNYVTFTPIKKKAYVMKSKLDNQNYDIPERVVVKAKPGLGFKAYVSNSTNKMPAKICRFVDPKEEHNTKTVIPPNIS